MRKNKKSKWVQSDEDIAKEELAKTLVENNLKYEYWETLVYNGRVYDAFEISNLGRVRVSCNKKILKQRKSGVPEYWYVILPKEYLGYRLLQLRVNRCVSWTFHGEPPEKGYTSDHINRNRYDNREVNLRWASKRTQMSNRDSTVKMLCGTPVVEYVRDLGYDISQGIGLYLTNRLRKDVKASLVDLKFDYANTINPYPKTWRERSSDIGEEHEGVWYPSTEVFVRSKGNCSKSTYLQRLREGMSVEEALTFKHDHQEHYRFEMDGFHMTTREHCQRLCISYQRIQTCQQKRGVSFEEAIKLPVERIIKHNINGVTKRNTEWYKHYNIPARNANSWLRGKRRDGTSFDRTFRDVLEKYGVDTSDMIIYPCDGEVVMKNKPL